MAIHSMCEARVCANLRRHRDRARRMSCPFAVEGPRSSRPVPRPEPSGSFHRSAASARFPTDLSCCPRECVMRYSPGGPRQLVGSVHEWRARTPRKSTRSIFCFPRAVCCLLCLHILLLLSWDTIQGPWTEHLVSCCVGGYSAVSRPAKLCDGPPSPLFDPRGSGVRPILLVL